MIWHDTKSIRLTTKQNIYNKKQNNKKNTEDEKRLLIHKVLDSC